MNRSTLRIAVTVVLACSALYLGVAVLRNSAPVFHLLGKKTVQDRLAEYRPAVRSRLTPALERSAVAYPPKSMTLVCLKKERRIELWCASEEGAFRHVKDYPILEMSGKQGPKLARGDLQVPEGIYRVEALNPNSLFHLALRLNYPNDFDLRKGRQDKRGDLGSDIMIHGGASSIGCMALGDPAVEELFTLAADTGLRNVTVLICPMDLRTSPASLPPDGPPWTAELYSDIQAELGPFHES